jgi:hypothetical protein
MARKARLATIFVIAAIAAPIAALDEPGGPGI